MVGVELGVCEAVVAGEQMDFISGLIDPLNVHFSLLVGLIVLVRLTLRLQPISVVQDSFRLKDLLSVLGHIGDHGVVGEVLYGANCFEALLLCHDRVDGGISLHSPCMLLRECFTDTYCT